MRLTSMAAILAASLTLAGPVLADEIEDSIKEALTAYENKDFSAAKHALDYASQLIAQKNAEGLGAVLPQPLDGWSAEDVETQDASAVMFGGIRAARNYEKGDERVELQILGDSPMLSTWMPMIANPAMAAAMGKMAKVGKYRAIQTKDGQLILVVANRFLVMVEGSASMKDKVDYASAIDFEKLESL